ncbi:MAG: hypothetical protein Q9218_000355 [Villophora microphyllina]
MSGIQAGLKGVDLIHIRYAVGAFLCCPRQAHNMQDEVGRALMCKIVRWQKDTITFARSVKLKAQNSHDETLAKVSADWDYHGYPPGPSRPSWHHRVTIKPEAGLSKEHQLWYEPSPYPPPNGRAGGWYMIIFSLHADAGIIQRAVFGQANRCEGGPVALSMGIRRRPPSGDVLSSENLSLVLEWLDDCEANHIKCNHERLPRLPTRVIDVQPTQGSDGARLVVSRRVPGNYIVLSHCWGERASTILGEEGQLLEGNLERLQRDIDTELLPQNFRDAISTARKLGVRYLWIDALCIIQDSQSDWARESARMDEIYEGAYLTLAATSAAMSTTGFLQPRNFPVAVRSFRDSIDPTIDSRYYLTYKHSVLDPWAFIEKETVWSTRGWTFQERLLSRRILHILPEEIVWECRTLDQTQSLEAPRSLDDRGYWILTKDEDPHGIGMPGHYAKYGRWYWIVRNYSPRRFTYDTDKLPALSGLARLFKRLYVPEDQYIAGLWRSDLLHGLLWMAHDDTLTSRPSGYCAPSWSWASIQGTPIMWPSRSIPMHCQEDFAVRILDISIQPATEDPMGLLSRAAIVVLGRVRQISHAARPAEPGVFLRFPFNLMCENDLIGNGAFDVPGDNDGQNIWILQVANQPPDYTYIPYHPTTLLLRQSTELTMHFRRIGYAVLEETNLNFFDCAPLEMEIDGHPHHAPQSASPFKFAAQVSHFYCLIHSTSITFVY